MADHQAQDVENTDKPSVRNTVTTSLDGDPLEVLVSYKNSVGHNRSWNKLKGIRVNVSSIYGLARDVYTTPPAGTFYYVVNYDGRQLVFVVQGRGGWLVGYYSEHSHIQLKLSGQAEPYMATPDVHILSFTGNHNEISGGFPGHTRIGLYSLRKAFDKLWRYRGGDLEPRGLRRAIGVFVIYLCEAAKFQPIFDRVCLSFVDPSVSRLDLQNDNMLDTCCKNWSSLSEEGMSHIHGRLTAAGNADEAQAVDIDNKGVVIIRTREDLHKVVRILHRDAFQDGVFNHEAKPPRPHFWEPVDPDDDNRVDPQHANDNDGGDDDDDDDDDDDERKRRRKEKKRAKRSRRPRQLHKLTTKNKTAAGGEPINYADILLQEWPYKFEDKKILVPVQMQETGLCKNLLQEYAQKMNYAIPFYVCTKQASGIAPFTCTVEIRGIQYIGASAGTKKDAEIKAARTALLAIQGRSEGHENGATKYIVVPGQRQVKEAEKKPIETPKPLKVKRDGYTKKGNKRKFLRTVDDGKDGGRMARHDHDSGVPMQVMIPEGQSTNTTTAQTAEEVRRIIQELLHKQEPPNGTAGLLHDDEARRLELETSRDTAKVHHGKEVSLKQEPATDTAMLQSGEEDRLVEPEPPSGTSMVQPNDPSILQSCNTVDSADMWNPEEEARSTDWSSS